MCRPHPQTAGGGGISSTESSVTIPSGAAMYFDFRRYHVHPMSARVARMLPSGPNAPPVIQSGPVVAVDRSLWSANVMPLVGNPNTVV